MCEELSREEAVQKQRKEAKKQRRKKRRNKNKESTHLSCESNCLLDKDEDGDGDDDEDEDVGHEEVAILPLPPPLHLQASRTPPPPVSCHCSIGHKAEHTKGKLKGVKGGTQGGKALRVGTTNNNEHQRKTKADCQMGKSGVGSGGGGWSSSRSPSPGPVSSLPGAKHSSNSGLARMPVATSTRDPNQPPLMTAPRKGPQESGYCSTNSSNLTTPEGSDVACTEGLCNHHSGMNSCILVVSLHSTVDFIFKNCLNGVGSPVQCRPSPSPVPECHDLSECEAHCNCVPEEDESHRNDEMARSLNERPSCPIHFKLRENCRNGRSLQQMLEVCISLVVLHAV